jgi:acid phosphatase family membrane protein YuiD
LKNGNQYKHLIKQLGRDPRLKRVIAKRQGLGKNAAKVESLTDIVLLILAIASRFATKKKARALDELMDIIFLLVQVSLRLKENIFDRPEVKEFFGQRSKEIYSFGQKYVAMVLPKTKSIRRKRKSQPA